MVGHVIIISLFVAALCFLFYFVRVLLKRYTKAKFAFAAMGSLSTLTLMIVASLLAKETPIQTVIGLIAEMRGMEYAPTAPSAFELVVVCFVTFLLHNTARGIFRDWDGPITIDQRRREIRREAAGLFAEGLRESVRLLRRSPESEVYTPAERTMVSSEMPVPDDTLAWHLQARELLMLGSSSLYFDESLGWHDRQSCWVGENSRSGEQVLLGCSVDKPSTAQLDGLVAYARRVSAGNRDPVGVELIWASREGTRAVVDLTGGVSVRCETEASLLDALVDFRDYFFSIKRRVETEQLPESDLKVGDVYVQSMCGVDDEEEPVGVELVLNEWLQESGRRQLALLGEYGQGKSTCALMFAYALIDARNGGNSPRIPILIELRGKAPSTMTPEELLSTWAVDYRIKASAIKKLLEAGRLVLIFDGFDEMAFVGQDEARIAHFRTIWQLCHPRAKILITGRPNFFLDDSELKAALGIRESTPGQPYCEALSLLPFGIEQMHEAVRAFDPTVGEEICALAQENAGFADLASRPSLLYIIAVLWKSGAFGADKERLNSAGVIDLFVRHSLSRQEEKSAGEKHFMMLTTPERRFFMDGVASYMHAARMPNQITGPGLQSAVLLLLEGIPPSVSEGYDAISGQRSISLRERVGDDEDRLSHLVTDVRTHGLLVGDPSKSGALKFAHKSFMELLAAKVVAFSLADRKDDAFAALRNITGIGVSTISRQEETFSFFAEFLAQQAAEGRDHGRDGLADKLFSILICRRRFFRPFAVAALRLWFSNHLGLWLRRRARAKRYLSRPGLTSDERQSLEDLVELTEPLRGTPEVAVAAGTFALMFWLAPLIALLRREIYTWLRCCFYLGIQPEAIVKVLGPGHHRRLAQLVAVEMKRYHTPDAFAPATRMLRTSPSARLFRTLFANRYREDHRGEHTSAPRPRD